MIKFSGNLPRGRGGSPQSPNRLNRESRSRPDRVGRARTSRVPPEIEFHLRFIRHQKISNITPQNFIRTSLHQYASVEENPQPFVGAKLGHCENNRMDNDGTVGWDEDEDARRLRPPNRSGPCWCKAHCDARILLWVPRGQHGMHMGGCEEQLRLGDVNGRAHARNRRLLRNEKKCWEVYSAFKRTRSASSRTEEGAWRAARAGRAAPPSDSKMVEGSRTTWRWRRYAEIINKVRKWVGSTFGGHGFWHAA